MRHQTLLGPVALVTLATCGLAFGQTVTVNAGDTRTLTAGDDTISATKIVNDGTIHGDNVFAKLIATDRIVNNGTISAESAQVRLETPTVEHNGLFKTRGPAAAISLNAGGLPLQAITGNGAWDVENGMNALGRFDVTTGAFLVRPDTVIGLGGHANSKLSVAHLDGGGPGPVYGHGRLSMGDNSTLTIRDGGGKAFTSDLEGGFRLVKNGAGTQTLTGRLEHFGGTEVNAGTLRVSDTTNAGGFGNFEVNAGGTLAASGTMNNFTFVKDGGHLASGADGRGEVSFFGLRLLEGSSLDLELASAGPSDLARVTNSGTHVGGTTVHIVDRGLVAGTTVWFFEYSNTFVVDANGSVVDDTITASDFTLAPLPAGLAGHLVAESASNGLDSGRVGFTVTAVPEPGALAVVGVLGASALLRRRRSM